MWRFSYRGASPQQQRHDDNETNDPPEKDRGRGFGRWGKEPSRAQRLAPLQFIILWQKTHKYLVTHKIRAACQVYSIIGSL